MEGSGEGADYGAGDYGAGDYGASDYGAGDYDYSYGTDNAAVKSLGDVAYYLNYVFLIVGTPGNLLSFCVLVLSFRQKGSVVYLYLAAVSLCDALFLALNSLMSIGSGTQPAPIYFDWLTHCHLFGPAIYIVSELSGLLLMMVTVNRFLTVFLPFRAKQWQSKKITCLVIASLVVLVLALNWFWFGGMKRVDEAELSDTHFWNHCQGRSALIRAYYWDVFPWVDLCFYMLLPSLTMLILNPGILIKIHLESKKGILGRKARGEGGGETTGYTKSSFVSKSTSSVDNAPEPKSEAEPNTKPMVHDEQVSEAMPSTTEPDTADSPKAMPSTTKPDTADSPKAMPSTTEPDTADSPKAMPSTTEPDTADSPKAMPSTTEPDTADSPKAMSSTTEPDTANSPKASANEENLEPKEIAISVIGVTSDASDGGRPVTPRQQGSEKSILRKWSRKAKEPKKGGGGGGQKSAAAAASSQNVRLTIICLVLSCSFLVLVAPILTFNLLLLVNMSVGGAPYLSPLAEDTLQEVGVLLLNVNHSINFLLYCVTSQAFRKHLKQMLCTK